MKNNLLNRINTISKRLIDIVLSFLLMIILFPIFLLVAVVIKVTSEGPVFFIQKRPGKNMAIFQIIKFRTMRIGSERMVKGKEVLINDERITNFGRFLRRSKLDELPQLINVLKGDMSLVGPRPERISSLEDYNDQTKKRLIVRPGMTGLAQVSGNIYLDLEDRYKYDIYYALNHNLSLDLKILVRTVLVIVFGEEKYKNKPLVKIN